MWHAYRKSSPVVKASQPFFLIMICVGTAVLSTAIVPFGIDDSRYSNQTCSRACMSIPWLVSTGFTIAFSAVFSKLHRINQLMASNMRKIKVTEMDVLKPFAVLFTINLIVLVIWTLVDPPEWSRQPVQDGGREHTAGVATSTAQYRLSACPCCFLL